MLAIHLLEEGAQEGGLNWFVWVFVLAILLVVFLGWLVTSKGWLKKEEDLVLPGDDHEHAEEHSHAEVETAEAVSFSIDSDTVDSAAADDLTVIEGIGPKVAKLLAGIGITTFAGLAAADLSKLREALDGAGYKYMEPAGWVDQAVLAAKGDLEGLKKLQDNLKGGRKVA